jgi:hypothetical protein
MRSNDEILRMHHLLNNDIFENGWDAAVEGALLALVWALSSSPQDDQILNRLMERPEDERRRDWIHRGGNPNEWNPPHKTKEP